MCGLAGIVDLKQPAPSKEQLQRTLDALANRGPDARRIWQEGPCSLVHSRLRILDVSERADQPMCIAKRGRLVMVYNGEVYNYRSLRDDLTKEGWEFETTSDAEVLLVGFRAWGEQVFRRARGMWATAFWEPDEHRLTLCRDPLGKKPLVYAVSHGRIAFASNVTALLSLLSQTPPIDTNALSCYLGHLCIPQEHSIFSGIDKVAPGATVTWNSTEGMVARRYWTPPSRPGRDMPRAEIVDEVERLLRLAVRRRLESDVPLGVFLSAGYDSGLVAALAAQESNGSLVAVTAGTTGSGYDERTPARLIADRYRLKHRPLEVDPLSAACLPILIAELGEPFGDSSLLPSFQVARAAREEITVALTGDGGDEGFFGYQTFRGVWLAERYRRIVPRWMRDALWRRNHSQTSAGWRRSLEAVLEYGREPIARAFRNRMGFSGEQRDALLLGPAKDGEHEAEHIYSSRLSELEDLPDADALRRTFVETYLPNDYLTKVDTATMAASLEARCPFLDVDLVEFLLSLSEADLFPGGRLKALLRPVAERHLPIDIVNRTKSGFGVPVARWLRGPLDQVFEEFVLRPVAITSFISAKEAKSLFAAHKNGADHSTRLWGLLVLGVWFAVVVERWWSANDPLPVKLH